jgi:F0F1-type ATP synthase assembly protein I
MAFNRPIPDRKEPTAASSGIGALVQAESLMQIALLLPSAAVIGWLAGAWLDSKLHQSWIGIAGLVFGSISGLVYVIRMAMTAERNSRPDTQSGNGNGKGSPTPEP